MSLVIPPCPNWYESSILACSPDNTLIYGARNDIVLIDNSTCSNIPAEVKIIPRAHSQKLVSVNINRNWNNPHKYIVSVGQDKVVSVWNADTLERKICHHAHINHSRVIGANFAGDERVVSVSEEGNIIIFNMSLNETNSLNNLFGFKVNVTCMSICPHASWLSAFGLKNGLVMVADLRKNGKILHKLRGHDKSVVSLSWCPASVNIFPKSPINYVGTKKDIIERENHSDSKTENLSVDNLKTVERTINDECPEETLQKSIVNGDAETEQKTSINILKELSQHNDNTNQNTESENTNLSLEVDQKKDETPNHIVHVSESDSENVINNITEIAENAKKLEMTQSASEINQNPPEENVEERKSSETQEDSSIVNTVIDSSEKVDESSDCDGAGTRIQKSMKESLNAESQQLQGEELKLTCESTERQITRNVPIEEQPRKEFLLASSAKENKIYIWRAGTDGRLQTFLTMPVKSSHRKNYTFDKMWITLHWATPTKLLSSSKTAELLQWTLPKPKDKSYQFSVIQNYHNTQLFSIAGPVALYNEYNWLDEADSNVWTTGQERLLLNTSLSSEKNILSAYPTFGGSVSCIQLSPLDPNRLAIGTNDGYIKLLDLSRPHIRNITMNIFYQKIQSKVMSLAWHPSNEVHLAYGTFEGRVGYLDVSNTSKAPVLFQPYFKTQIHKVEYGPLNGNIEEVALYALSEGNLVRYIVKDPKEDPLMVDKPDDTYVYTFSWKPDYSMLVVSTKKNSLIQYSANLEIMLTKYIDHRIQDICWHPDAVNNGTNSSKYQNYFASISNSKSVVVIDFGPEATNKDEMIISKYEGQLELINCLSWSPYDCNHLAIASDIGIGVIWDITNNVTIASYFCNNFDPISAMIWSPLDKNLIISGGKDQTLKIWKISDYPPQDESELKIRKKELLKDAHARSTEFSQKDDKTNEEIVKPKKAPKSRVLPNFYSTVKRQTISDLRKLLSWKENPSEYVPENNTNEPDILDIFGPNENMKNVLKINENHLNRRGQYSQKIQLSLFGGDISSSIREAINEKRVSPFIISLAPMVSPKLWQEACLTYADQLSPQANADPIEIATYYLACHKVEAAVDILCDRSMFQEALVLAKSRLIENDKTILEILEKWAKSSLLIGNFETSAQCYICLGKYEDAASVLFRRSDLETLEFAGELAEKSGNTELHKAVKIRYNAFAAESSKEKELTETLSAKADLVLANAEHTHSENTLLTSVDSEETLKECSTKSDNLEDKQDKNAEPVQNGYTNGVILKKDDTIDLKDNSLENENVEIKESEIVG